MPQKTLRNSKSVGISFCRSFSEFYNQIAGQKKCLFQGKNYISDEISKYIFLKVTADQPIAVT